MERRKFSRYPIECPVSIRLLEADVGGEIARGTTLNMASRGLLVATDQRLPQGASVGSPSSGRRVLTNGSALDWSFAARFSAANRDGWRF